MFFLAAGTVKNTEDQPESELPLLITDPSTVSTEQPGIGYYYIYCKIWYMLFRMILP